jgi:Tol biopolymer transport system component
MRAIGGPRRGLVGAAIMAAAAVAVLLAAVTLSEPRGGGPRLGAGRSETTAGPTTGARIVAWNLETEACATIGVMDPSSGATTARAECSPAVPAPDGRRVAVGRDHDLIIQSLVDGSERVLTSAPAGSVRPIAWSPAGRYVAWGACPSDGNQPCFDVWTSAADGSSPDVHIGPGIPTWTAQDKRVSIEVITPNGSSSWATGSGAGADRVPFDGSTPRWSPDGLDLLSVEANLLSRSLVDVVLRRGDGSDATVVASVACCVGSIDWSPDGSRAVVTSVDPDVGLASAPDEIVLVDPINPPETVSWFHLIDVSIGWSPAGSRFLVAGTRFGASAPTTLVAFTDLARIPIELGDDVVAAWSPDGAEIAVVGQHGGVLTIVSADDGSLIRTLERPVVGPISRLVWAP